MALVVEDGSGKPDAESYVSVLDADAYAAARLIDIWSAIETTTAIKEAALRRATEYLDMEYGLRLKGVRSTQTQALEFPRFCMYLPKANEPYPDDTIPVSVSRACIELAVIALSGPLYSIEDRTRVIIEEAKGVGPLTKRFRYSEPDRLQRLYVQVQQLMLPFVENAGVLRSVRI
jgi:hypothetical protein